MRISTLLLLCVFCAAAALDRRLREEGHAGGHGSSSGGDQVSAEKYEVRHIYNKSSLETDNGADVYKGIPALM